MNPLIVANTQIRRDSAGRYCLNDLHQASGNAKRYQPANWLRLDQTRELIAEVENSQVHGNKLLRSEELTAGCSAVEAAGGRGGGTYVVKELVYAYAMWLSPKFHLHVVRAYDRLVTDRLGRGPIKGDRLRAMAMVRSAQRDLHRATQRGEIKVAYGLLENACGLLDIDCPPLADFQPPDPYAEARKAFWATAARLEASGQRLNHARDPALVALNLTHMAELAKQQGMAFPAQPILRKVLASEPRLRGHKAVSSALRPRRTVKCWVFAAPQPSTAATSAAMDTPSPMATR